MAGEQSVFIADYNDSVLYVEIKPIENLFAQLEQMMDQKK
jgi:hypothetical protein